MEWVQQLLLLSQQSPGWWNRDTQNWRLCSIHSIKPQTNSHTNSPVLFLFLFFCRTPSPHWLEKGSAVCEEHTARCIFITKTHKEQHLSQKWALIWEWSKEGALCWWHRDSFGPSHPSLRRWGFSGWSRVDFWGLGMRVCVAGVWNAEVLVGCSCASHNPKHPEFWEEH